MSKGKTDDETTQDFLVDYEEMVELEYHATTPEWKPPNYFVGVHVKPFYENTKHTWNRIKDGQYLKFNDHTSAIMTKLDLRPLFCSTDLVKAIHTLKTTCTNINSPTTVSVVAPAIEYGCDCGEHHLLRCVDCKMIEEVAGKDFRKGDLNDCCDRKCKHKFNFGQKLVDQKNGGMVIIVGETCQYVYVLEHDSYCKNMEDGRCITPLEKPISDVTTIAMKKGLNFRVIKECAAFHEFVE